MDDRIVTMGILLWFIIPVRPRPPAEAGLCDQSAGTPGSRAVLRWWTGRV